MSDEFLQPSSLETPSSGPPPDPKKKGPSYLWLLAVLVVAGLAGIRFFSQLTGEVDVARATPTPLPQPTATPDPALRAAADAALERVLEVLGPLRAAEPERWAGEEWAEIQEGISKADQQMADQHFKAAADMYSSLLPPLQNLSDRLPQLPDELMPKALAAYEAGQKEDAVAYVEIILFLEPEYPGAKEFLPRAEQADRSFALLENAKARVEEAEWDQAWADLNRLQTLDSEFPGGNELLEVVTRELSQAEFEKWISQALLALEQGDLMSAEALVKKAAGFQPKDPSVLALQEQIQDRIIQGQVLEIKYEAEEAESREHWAEAYERWLEMKALDPEAPWIQEGLAQSLKWKIFEEKIRKGFENPASEQTGVWVNEMRERAGWPPLLSQNAERLIEARTLALTPVTVTLTSDFETRVEISRVGRWQPFYEKEVMVKPGKYVAKGIRMGYRDVRVPFEVKPGQQNLQIDVICTEGI